jgi:hypothetical protein
MQTAEKALITALELVHRHAALPAVIPEHWARTHHWEPEAIQALIEKVRTKYATAIPPAVEPLVPFEGK